MKTKPCIDTNAGNAYVIYKMNRKLESEWNKNFDGAFPIDFQFKYYLNKRWFRIHCLPESKRYAENSADYKVVKERQNTILKDLICEPSEIVYLIGFFSFKEKVKPDLVTDLGVFQHFMSIDIHKNQNIIPFGPYYEGDCYETYTLSSDINLDKLSKTLIDLANDTFDYRFSFVDFHKGRIVMPYDGGMDIIMENEEARNSAKLKYGVWASKREDVM